MKRQFMITFALGIMLLVSACVPIPLPPGRPTEVQPSPELPEIESAQAEAVAMSLRQMLMQQLGANFEAIEIVSVEAKEWPDGCLGLPTPDEACTLAIVPGYEVTLAVNSEMYVYRSNADASTIRLAEAPATDMGAVAMEWTQNADAGVCATAQLGVEGAAFGLCGGPLLGLQVASPDYAHDLGWFVNTYAPFEAETAAGHLLFNGTGTQTATPAEERMLAEWAQLAYHEASAGRSGASWGLAFAWHREGGIAGFCDDLTVYVTGRVYASSCRGNEPQTLGKARLDAAQLAQLYDWVDTLQSFEFEQRDPSVADAMTIRMVFSGAGEIPASAEIQAGMETFASTLFAEVSN